MFPFNLAGPQFLLFYAVLAAVALSVYAYFLSTVGSGGPPARLADLTADPYRIAILRADRDEAVRVAIVNLVDRGLLEADGEILKAGKSGAAEFVRRALDRAVLQACANPRSFDSVRADARVAAACADYERELEASGLVFDAGHRHARLLAMLVALAVVGGLGVTRLLQAFSRGHSNILFLLLLGAFACWVAVRLVRGRATPAGRKALTSLQTLTAKVKKQADRLRSGGATNEALLLAAVYGIYALPSSAYAFVEGLFPKPKPQSNSNSCGSSSSCGSGSSCGGGGGGCGGCGGG